MKQKTHHTGIQNRQQATWHTHTYSDRRQGRKKVVIVEAGRRNT